MKKTVLTLVVLAVVAVGAGCRTCKSIDPTGIRGTLPPALGAASAVGGEASDRQPVQPDRMLIWKASLGIEVWSVETAVADAVAMAERQDGYAERKSDSGAGYASLTIRIPAKVFKDAVSEFETLGTVTRRDVEGQDVTEEYIDADARLKNKIVLRDRLKQLLDKATDVKDILAIETELNRVQGDIDSLEGRIKSLKGQVDYATVQLDLRRKPILGPLGYLCKGLWCGIEKLFVLRD
ncbi:MAG: hypothetical protein A3K19_21315 [Lentisphaerae bacterium RIFOXYB12_FULL_65_16]|nr:MAG: hypothetical protein A3K18_33990 [Lentisphaerae bacterium RIFOXYA12_64_32]OGV93672.1 MAG: hypothetical protein A3K19_21315 [Lentisphaerae bacterium RIFOXYB12_FULL_65_16]